MHAIRVLEEENKNIGIEMVDVSKEEKALQDKIFAGIDDVKRYLETHECVDEYIYVMLWRPIEWIIDYYSFLRAKSEGVTFTDFWEEQVKLGVDKKTRRMADIVSEDIYNAMHSLRDYRNRAVHRYSLEDNPDIFTNFDSVCKDFCKETGKKPHILKKACDYGTKFNLNKFLGENDPPASEGDKKLLYSIMEALNESNPNVVMISCKMENLAQRYAKELLMSAGHVFSYKNQEGKNGIYIDDRQESILTYIDYYVEEFRIRKSEKQTKELLATIRGVRNAAMHNPDISRELFERLKITWKKLMQDYFCDDECILNALEEINILDISLGDALNTLQAYVAIDKEYYSEGAFEEISDLLVFFVETITSVRDLKESYQTKMNNAKSEDERESIKEELIKEIEAKNTAFYNRQNEKTLTQWEGDLESLLGNNNDRIRGNVRNYLKTALLLSNMLEERAKKDKRVDCAGACIEYTRAIEAFLFESIYQRYKKYRSDRGWEYVKTIKESEYKKNRITLGLYGPIFGIKTGNWKGDSERKEYEEEQSKYISFCKEEMLYGSIDEDEIVEISNKEYQKINHIKEKYRDRSAHRLSVVITDLENCIEDIIRGKDALLTMLMDDINDPACENR